MVASRLGRPNEESKPRIVVPNWDHHEGSRNEAGNIKAVGSGSSSVVATRTLSVSGRDASWPGVDMILNRYGTGRASLGMARAAAIGNWVNFALFVVAKIDA